MRGSILCISLFILSCKIIAAESETLLQTSQSWNGGSFAYPSGEPEVTMLKVTIAAEESIPFHCHPVPTFGYVAKGSIEVETKAGKVRTFTQGEAIMEAMNTVHKGKSVNGPAEILVFYAGAKGLNNTHLADHTSCIATKR